MLDCYLVSRSISGEENIPNEFSGDQVPRLFSIKKAYLLLQCSGDPKIAMSL